MSGRGERRVALVTGAGGGLGGALALALADKGFDLILNDIADSEALAAVAAAVEAHGGRAAILPQDITRDKELTGYVERAHAAFGRLDCLVNNAGVSVLSRGDILDVSPESFDRCMAVNLRGQFFLTQAVARRMIAEGGPAPGEPRRSIVFVTTVAVENIIGKVLAEYSASKAALSHLVKHFAVRLTGEGIDCYEVRPGIMATTMTASSKEKYAALIAGGFVPAGRSGDLGEVSRVVANLADGALSYCVGQAINLDGGLALKTF